MRRSPQAQPAQGLVEGLEVGEGLLCLPGGEPALRLGKGLLPAKEPGQLGHGPGRGQVPQGVQQLGEGGVVFGLDGGAKLLLHPGGDGELVGQDLEKPGVADLHPEVLHAGGEGRHRRGDGLQVGPEATGPHELDTHLGGLVAAAGEVGPVAVDVLAVVEPQGLFVALEPGGRHAGDGQGGVRPEHQEPAVVIGALVHLLLGDGGAGEVEHIEIFQAGGDDLPVAPEAEEPGELGLGLPAGGALLEEEVPGALGGHLAVGAHRSRPFCGARGQKPCPAASQVKNAGR